MSKTSSTPRTAREELALHLTSCIGAHEQVLKAWKVKFEQDPVRAFAWSDQALTAAVERGVALHVLAILNNIPARPNSIVRLHEILSDELVRKARDYARSTHAVDFAMERQTVSSLACIIESLSTSFAE